MQAVLRPHTRTAPNANTKLGYTSSPKNTRAGGTQRCFGGRMRTGSGRSCSGPMGSWTCGLLPATTPHHHCPPPTTANYPPPTTPHHSTIHSTTVHHHHPLPTTTTNHRRLPPTTLHTPHPLESACMQSAKHRA